MQAQAAGHLLVGAAGQRHAVVQSSQPYWTECHHAPRRHLLLHPQLFSQVPHVLEACISSRTIQIDHMQLQY